MVVRKGHVEVPEIAQPFKIVNQKQYVIPEDNNRY